MTESDDPKREEASTVAAPTAAGDVLRVHAAVIEVTVGPDTGRTARLDSPTFVVGVGDGADLRLTDTTVSREHLRLSLTPKGVRIRDEGSKNGTWLGGVRLTDALLTSDTTLTLGTTAIMLRIESGPLDLPLSAQASFGEAHGVSAAMRHVFSVLERAAPSDVTILLEGESGVGKEILARAVHDYSRRGDGPFVAVDCGAIPPTLIESELFGHERGAFTGAFDNRMGVFEQANGGTLFLDEIGELPLDLQPKLLRVLEQREVRPLGSKGLRPIDVRVLAATNRRLAEAAHKNEFRRDLFYRLAVVRVVIPPLRDRTEDILPLGKILLREATGDAQTELPADLAAMLRSYEWPGNVRELRNVIDRYALVGLRDAQSLFDANIQGATPPGGGAPVQYSVARRRAIDRFEREYLTEILQRAGGAVARAAEMANVARPSFYRMLQRARLSVKGDDAG